MVAEYHNQSKLRFWCQMVLPLVYDDSLSYMELLNKVVSYLNNCIQDVGNCETNIESLLEAFVNLQDYVNEITEGISPLIEEKIDEMIESGELGEILADALATVVSPEYDESESYVPLNYAIYNGTLYCCTSNTTGEWDSTKWRETTVGDELNTLMQKVSTLNAGDVSFDPTETYESGTVGNKLKNLTANDIEYNSSETYNNATVGKELSNLNSAIKNYLFLGSGDDAPTIENGTNYNNITSIGVYRVLTKASAGTMINTPNTNYTHRLIVMCLVNSSSIVQVFICNYDTNPAIFTRIKTTDGVWSPWRLLSPIRNSVITVSAGTGTQSFTWNICSPDLLVSNVYYSNPKAVGSDVTFTTGDGTISISGTFYEATDIHFDVQ